MRIVVLGGGFGGVTAVRNLEMVLRRRADVEITLVSRENFFVLTPLLRSGAIRPSGGRARQFLTVVVIGGGLVGVELVGELTAFADDVLRFYPRIRRDEVRFRLFQASPRILPELDEKLAAVAARVLQRGGVDIRVATAVRSIEAGRVRLENDTVEAGTIVLVAGIVPSTVASAISVARDPRGRISVDATMRSRSHPHVWALGDCATIPGPDGRPYPALAQHVVREARQLASNIRATIDGQDPVPFMFRSLGTMASLGNTRAVARVFGVPLTGFVAWWLRRTYYLFRSRLRPLLSGTGPSPSGWT